MDRRKTMLVSVAIAMAAVMSDPALAARKTITVWHPWGGVLDFAKTLTQIAKDYTNSHPGVEVRMLPVPYGANGTPEKFLVSVAAGTAPDIVMLPGVGEFAERGLIAPMDEFVSKSRLNANAMFPVAWERGRVGGKLYAMPLGMDVNFAMMRNPRLFAEAGAPDEGPRTIADLSLLMRKLTRRGANGKVSQLASSLWDVYGYPNTLNTWGWAFGSQQVDASKKKVLLNSAKYMKAVGWLAEEAKAIPVKEALSAYNNLWIFKAVSMGKIAMAPMSSYEMATFKKQFPEFTYRLSKMPYQEGEDPNVAWIGGWSMCMPKKAKNRSEAWDFIQYLSASDEGTSKISKGMGFWPGYRHSPFYKGLNDSNERMFESILDGAKYLPAQTPIDAVMGEQLSWAWTQIFLNGKEPAAIMKQAADYCQKQWDAVLKRRVK